MAFAHQVLVSLPALTGQSVCSSTNAVCLSGGELFLPVGKWEIKYEAIKVWHSAPSLSCTLLHWYLIYQRCSAADIIWHSMTVVRGEKLSVLFHHHHNQFSNIVCIKGIYQQQFYATQLTKSPLIPNFFLPGRLYTVQKCYKGRNDCWLIRVPPVTLMPKHLLFRLCCWTSHSEPRWGSINISGTANVIKEHSWHCISCDERFGELLAWCCWLILALWHSITASLRDKLRASLCGTGRSRSLIFIWIII